MSMSTIAFPGQVLASVTTHIPGPGTHVYESNIQASLAGPVVIIAAPAPAPEPSPSTRAKPTISVGWSSSNGESASSIVNVSHRLPQVGSIVLGRVLRVQRLQLTISILMVDPANNSTDANLAVYTSVTNDELQPQAILRREDVRAYEKDKVVMNESFRSGDIVRAVVISLGDERNYYISTAGNEYGVLVAKSVDGHSLVPVSWKEMRDVVTGKGEARKVAKPV